MGFGDRLYERLEFYRKAYEDASGQVEKMRAELDKSEKLLCTGTANTLDETIPKQLLEEAVNGIEQQYGVELNDIACKCAGLVEKSREEIQAKKSDSRYKEYLHLVMDEDLKTVIDLERDEVFSCLIEQDFHNEHFRNEPFLQIFGYKYQPRFWKFAAIADKKAKELGLDSYQAMFKLWENLRINYKSLAEDQKITDIMDQCKGIEAEIKALEERIDQMPVLYRSEVITRLVEFIKTQPAGYLGKVGMTGLMSLQEQFSSLQKTFTGLSERVNQIMSNISSVEKMVEVYELEGKVRDEKVYESFFHNEDPAVPVFTLIPEEEWKEIERAFAQKDIKLKSRENYTVVRTKISRGEKEALLNQYGVKEGEIFVDEALKGKKF
jgi:hypothetical protein